MQRRPVEVPVVLLLPPLLARPWLLARLLAPLLCLIQGTAADCIPVLNGSVPMFRLLLDTLLSIADGAYLVEVACATNWRGAPYSNSSQAILGCVLLKQAGSQISAVAVHMHFAPNNGNIFPKNCADALEEYIFTQECCAGTISESEKQWINVSSLPIFALGYLVDWGGGRPPQLFQ